MSSNPSEHPNFALAKDEIIVGTRTLIKDEIMAHAMMLTVGADGLASGIEAACGVNRTQMVIDTLKEVARELERALDEGRRAGSERF